jgi:hypothetical protein
VVQPLPSAMSGSPTKRLAKLSWAVVAASALIGPKSALMDEQTVAWHVMSPAPSSLFLKSRVVGIVRVNEPQFFACPLGTVVQSDKETGHDSSPPDAVWVLN